MIIDEEGIASLKAKLQDQGSVSASDKKGNRLHFIETEILSDLPRGLLIVYEGIGAFLFTLDRPLNKFRLVKAGFPLHTASWLSDLVNHLTGFADGHNRRSSGPLMITALEPSNDGEDL